MRATRQNACAVIGAWLTACAGGLVVREQRLALLSDEERAAIAPLPPLHAASGPPLPVLHHGQVDGVDAALAWLLGVLWRPLRALWGVLGAGLSTVRLLFPQRPEEPRTISPRYLGKQLATAARLTLRYGGAGTVRAVMHDYDETPGRAAWMNPTATAGREEQPT